MSVPLPTPAFAVDLDRINAIDGVATVEDISGFGILATLAGDIALVEDATFGSCLANPASGPGGRLDIAEMGTALFYEAWTVAGWVMLDSGNATSRHTLFAAQATDGEARFALTVAGDGTGLSLDAGGAPLQGPDLTPGTWHHVAVSVDVAGNVEFWKDGAKATFPRSAQFPDPLTRYWGWTATLGGAEGAQGVAGRISRWRIYGTLLGGAEIARLHAIDRAGSLAFHDTAPLDVALWDETGRPAIYLEGGEVSHGIRVALWNRDPQRRPITLAALSAVAEAELSALTALNRLRTFLALRWEERDAALEAMDETTRAATEAALEPVRGDNKLGTLADLQTAFFDQNHHFELRFPRATLSSRTRAWIETDIERMLARAPVAPRTCYIHYRQLDSGEDSLRVLVIVPPAPIPVQPGPDEVPGVELALPHIAVDSDSSAETLPVEVRPGPLTRREGHAALGPRVRRLEVLSERGKQTIPLHFDVVGGNTVLNKDVPGNILFRLTNTHPTDPIALDVHGRKRSRFQLSVEISERAGVQEWALTDSPEKVRLLLSYVTAPGATAPDPGTSHLWSDQDLPWESNGRIVTWDIDPRDFDIEVLKPGASLYMMMTVRTTLPTGPSDLHLHYRDVPGYWDGSRACTVQKSPLVFHRDIETGAQRVGIGTDAPDATLSVQGSIAVSTGETDLTWQSLADPGYLYVEKSARIGEDLHASGTLSVGNTVLDGTNVAIPGALAAYGRTTLNGGIDTPNIMIKNPASGALGLGIDVVGDSHAISVTGKGFSGRSLVSINTESNTAALSVNAGIGGGSAVEITSSSTQPAMSVGAYGGGRAAQFTGPVEFSGPVEMNGKLNMSDDVNMNGKRTVNGLGMPLPDISYEVAVELNATKSWDHNLGRLPQLVQIWVRPSSMLGWFPKGQRGENVARWDSHWRMAGVLSLWSDGHSYGVVTEEISENRIKISTGSHGLYHSTKPHTWFTDGYVWVRLWF